MSLDEERIAAIVRDTMQEQQRGILQAAATNAGNLVAREIQQSAIQVRDVIDDELERSHHDAAPLKNNINKSNHDFCKQIQDIWGKTERAISNAQYDRAKELCTTGKNLTKKRLKVLRLADNDGWDTALAYLSDDLASNSEDEKRIKKAKRTVVKNKEEAAKRQTGRFTDTRYSTQQYTNQGSSTSTPRYTPAYTFPSTSRNRYINSSRGTRPCWVCGKAGHFADSCRYAKQSRF